MNKNQRMLLSKEGRKFFVSDTKQDYHCQYGVVKKELLKKTGAVKTNKGEILFCLNPSFSDLLGKISRNAQIMLAKDIGYIISTTGINSKSIVLDAGSGSGAAACAIANIAKKVVTCDVDERSIETTRKNISFLGMKNIVLKKLDIYNLEEAEKELKAEKGKFDVFVLDVPQPWDALHTADKMLKNGGFLVSYSPSITQSQLTVNSSQKFGLFHVKTVELIERSWTIDERRCRPNFDSLGHTGFLSFFRKI